MKTYNTKLSAIVFIAIITFDAAWYCLWHEISSHWLGYPMGVISFVINLPGIPPFHYLADFVRAGYWSDGGSMIGCLLFSALVWSLISGFVFRHKYAA